MPSSIYPLPEGKGVGLATFGKPLDEAPSGYRHEQVGPYHNYYVTPDAFRWPIRYPATPQKTIDAFAPNLNKFLHVGHLRQLALAKSLSALLPHWKFVGMFGYAHGVKEGAGEALKAWFDFLNYRPKEFRDIDLTPGPSLVFETGPEGEKLWRGPAGELVVVRSPAHPTQPGKPTYVYHDLCFAEAAKPDYYVTAVEQKEHFQSLGLGEKHLPMGLVLDSQTGRKMKSRVAADDPEAKPFMADEALAAVMQRLDQTSEPKKLAWNVIAWNMLHVNRTANVSFDVKGWTDPDSPGVYISYTAARLRSILKKANWRGTAAWVGDEYRPTLEQRDAELVGYGEYRHYWKNRAIQKLDPSGLANYLHDFARKIGKAYHAEQVVGGRPALLWAVTDAYLALVAGMMWLGMFPVESV